MYTVRTLPELKFAGVKWHHRSLSVPFVSYKICVMDELKSSGVSRMNPKPLQHKPCDPDKALLYETVALLKSH